MPPIVPTMGAMNVVKGSTIRARWFENVRIVGVDPFSIAGVQPKGDARERIVTGIVRHVRGNGAEPTKVRIYIDGPGADVTPPGCTCGPHVEVDPQHVVSVEGASE